MLISPRLSHLCQAQAKQEELEAKGLEPLQMQVEPIATSRQLLPDDRLGLHSGRPILVWGVEDAQFLFARVISTEVALPAPIQKTPTAAATKVALTASGSAWLHADDPHLFC